MLSLIQSALPLVPLKTQVTHNCIVITEKSDDRFYDNMYSSVVDFANTPEEFINIIRKYTEMDKEKYFEETERRKKYIQNNCNYTNFFKMSGIKL